MRKILVAVLLLAGFTAPALVIHNSPALANHESASVVTNIRLIANDTSHPDSSIPFQGGVFVGAGWGLLGVEAARFESSSNEPFSFIGLSSQPVVFPLAGPSRTIILFPVRWVLSLGSLDGTFGGRIGLDIVLQFSDYEVYNVFAGASQWMNVDGLRIATFEIGFGF
ncbi:MAG: hypothetical protein HYT22_02270 [Candidatus Niyogibacteria bacterium]|nr:hypothetical protein [Candidatus Niyogibacteria bacterium]